MARHLARGPVKAEAVHVHLPHPELQAIDDELLHNRVIAVERVTAPQIVLVILPVLLNEMVIDFVGKALEIERGSQVVALVGVVKNYVEDDGYVGPVARFRRTQ